MYRDPYLKYHPQHPQFQTTLPHQDERFFPSAGCMWGDDKCKKAVAKWKELKDLPDGDKLRFWNAWSKLIFNDDSGEEIEEKLAPYNLKKMKLLMELKEIYKVMDWVPKKGRVPVPIYFWYSIKKKPMPMMLGDFYNGVMRDLASDGFGRCRAPGKLDYVAAKAMSFLG